jgi:hypothetical protein
MQNVWLLDSRDLYDASRHSADQGELVKHWKIYAA